MTNNDELAMKLKAAAEKAVDNFDPNMFILTRDMAALLAERDADKKRIAELEARTLTVKFDPIAMEELGNRNQGKKHPYMFGAGYNSAVVSCKCALENACAAAGIKLEVGE